MAMGDKEEQELRITVARLEVGVNNLIELVAELKSDVKRLSENYVTKDELHEAKEQFVSKTEFKPIRTIVWSAASLVITTVVLAILSSVLK